MSATPQDRNAKRRKAAESLATYTQALPRDKQIELFRLIRGNGQFQHELMEPLVASLVKSIHGRRQHHAQRIWTGWLEPVVARSPELLWAGRRMPGLLHLNDVKAWWATLSPFFAGLVAEIQQRIEARNQLIDDVIASVEGREWAEALRKASLEVLAGATPGKPRAALLAEVNRHRQALAAGDRRLPETLRPLGDADFEWFRLALEIAPRNAAFLAGEGGRAPDGIATVRYALALSRDPVLPAEAALLLPLALTHRLQDPELLIVLNRRLPSRVIAETAFAHLDLAVAGMMTLARRELGIDAGGEGFRRELPTTRGLDSQSRLALLWLDATGPLRVEENRDLGLAHRDLVQSIVETITEEVSPILARRVENEANFAGAKELAANIRWVEWMQGELRRRGIAIPPSPWHHRVAEQLANMFRHALRAPDTDTFSTLATIADVADAMKLPVQLSVLETGLFAAATERLRREAPLDAAEAALMRRLLKVAETEMRESRRWVDPLVTGFVEACAGGDFSAGPHR